MVLWEMNSKTTPFSETELFNTELEIEICFNDLRPKMDINEGWDQDYMQLIKSCWNKTPENRPDAKSIAEELRKLRKGEKINFSNFFLQQSNAFDKESVIIEDFTSRFNPFYVKRKHSFVHLFDSKKTKSWAHLNFSQDLAGEDFSYKRSSAIGGDSFY